MTAISSNVIRVVGSHLPCTAYEDGLCVAWGAPLETNWTLAGCTVSGSVHDSGNYGARLLRGYGNQIVPNNSGYGALTFTSNTLSCSCP
jgi:hypothetical protein